MPCGVFTVRRMLRAGTRIVFYEIVTGRKPFVGDTTFVTLQKHCTEAPTPPSAVALGIPRPLEAIILRLLSKTPPAATRAPKSC